VGFLAGSIINPTLATIYMSCEQVLRALGYSMLLATSSNDPHLDVAYLRLMSRRRVDGLVVSSAVARFDLAAEQVASMGAPAVMLDRDVPAGARISAVVSDHASGMREAVLHLAKLGHRRIALVNGFTNVRPFRERLAGYQAGLQTAGITSQPDLVSSVPVAESAGYVQTQMLLDMPDPPSAIIAGANVLLLGILKLVQERRLVIGRDVALVGCDDLDIARLYTPPITVVARDLSMLGETAAHLLIQTIESGHGRTVNLPTYLLVRGSSTATGLDSAARSAT
jgi:LacI family transcriptional regulator